MIIYYALASMLVAAAVCDVTWLRIPNPICGAIVALFLLAVVGSRADLNLVAHFGAAALVLLVGWALFLAGVMGGGDVKLFAATSLWVGFDLLIAHVVYVSLLGLVLLAALFAARFLAGVLIVRFHSMQGDALPPSLHPGNGVPYGVAIAAAALLLMNRMSPTLWIL